MCCFSVFEKKKKTRKRENDVVGWIVKEKGRLQKRRRECEVKQKTERSELKKVRENLRK